MRTKDLQYENSEIVEIEIERISSELLSPEPLSSLDELNQLIKPRPGYIGPGEWLKILK